MILEQLQRLVDGEKLTEGLAPMGIRHVHVGAGALQHLTSVVEGLRSRGKIALLHDATPMTGTDGEDVKLAVAATLRSLGEVTVVTLSGDVHADETTVDEATRGCAEADVVVTVGSGTMSDIGKVAAGSRPHVIVQTAASVDGFADDQSVLLRRGVKRTVQTAWPHALLVDIDILTRAPLELTRSGLGDAITMFTAPADWYLATALGMADGWNEEIALLARKHGEQLLGVTPGLGSRDPDSIEVLAGLLTLRGMAMGMVGQTSPGSGMEHTASHLLDMRAGADMRPNAPHGAQVGVSAIIGAGLWARVCVALQGGKLEVIDVPSDAEAEERVQAAFAVVDSTGTMGEECWRDYRNKLERMRAVDLPRMVAKFVESWPTHRAWLDKVLVPAERVEAALAASGAYVSFRELPSPPSAEAVEWAFAHGHLMRSRFTVADLADAAGLWSAALVREAVEGRSGPAQRG